MSRRKHVTIWIGVLAAAALALFVPESPLYLPDLLAGNKYEGRSQRAWIKDLRSADAQKRLKAIGAIARMGAVTEDIVPELARLLAHDSDARVRAQASFALSLMSPASRAAVTELAKAVSDPEPEVRGHAVVALQRLKTEASAALPALIAALRDDENHVPSAASYYSIHESIVLAIGRVGAESDDIVPTLIELLGSDSTQRTQLCAVWALRDLGAPARAAAPSLRVLVRGQDPHLRDAATEALAAIGESETGAATGAPELYELPENERHYLWQIEQGGNLLVKHGFGPLANALNAGDATGLMQLLADDFVCADMHEPASFSAQTGPLTVERLQPGRTTKKLDRASFVDRLLAFRKQFKGNAPSVKVALMRLSPQRRLDLDGPWQGTAQLRFAGEQSAGDPAEVVIHFRYEIPRPTAGELAKPGWLRQAEVLQVLQGRSAHPLFVENARGHGLRVDNLHDNWRDPKFVPTTGGVFVTDFDRDGILDVLVTDVNGAALYRGHANGRFEDQSSARGLPPGPLTNPVAVWADLDGDGWDDLVLGHRVYRNDAGRRFEDITARCMLPLPRNFANIVVADYDRDGLLDLYVARPAPPGGNSWLDARGGNPRGNYLLRNKGDWQFEDVTRFAKADGGRRSTFTAAWLDANNDGWPDVFVPNEFGDGVLLVNQRDGTFKEQMLADQMADFGTMGLAAGDLDNDGNIDLYCANMYSKAGTRVIGNMAADAYPPKVMERIRRFVAGSQLHVNRGGLKFDQRGTEKQVAAVGWAYGTALADFDGDGLLDIYATAGYVSRSRDDPDG